MGRWTRVAPLMMFVVFSAVFTAIGLTIFLVVSISLLSSTAEVVSWPGMVFALGFIVIWTAFAFRLNRLGLFISHHGVRVRKFLTTRTLAWQDVAGFEVRPISFPVAGFISTMMGGRAIWVITAGGPDIQTYVSYSSFRMPGM